MHEKIKVNSTHPLPLPFLLPQVHVVEGSRSDSRTNASTCIDDVPSDEAALSYLFLLEKEGEVHASILLLPSLAHLLLFDAFQIFAFLQ